MKLKERNERSRIVLFCKTMQQTGKMHEKKGIFKIGQQSAMDGDPWKTDGDSYSYSYPLATAWREFPKCSSREAVSNMEWSNIGEDWGEVKHVMFLRTKFLREEVIPEIELGMSAVISSPNIPQSID